MLPKTETSTAPCSNISSNCVIWQGPNIPCIDLCTGDTVSDVIAALAQQLCDLVIPEPNLDGLDLLCTLPAGQSQPDTVKDVLQFIIDYICDEEDEPGYQLPIIPLPACLSPYTDDQGNQFTSLPLDQYAILLADEICTLIQAVQIIQVTLGDHEIRLTILEDCVLDADGNCNIGGGDPQVFSTCILENQTIAASVLLVALEERYCDLETAVGAPPLIGNAVNQASCITSSEPMLSSPGTYGGVAGWVASPTTLAHAVGNAWIVICDMHQAIQDIQLNCCPGACDSIVFDFNSEIITNNAGNPTGVELTFQDSIIPSGWNDCGGSTTITITDSNGVTAQDVFSFVNYAGTTTPFLFDLQNTSLTTVGTLTTSINFCITDGQDTCDAIVTDTTEGALQCPENVQVNDIDELAGTANITFTHYLGTSAVYLFVVTNTDNNTQLTSFTQSGLPVNATIQLSNLAEDTNYSVEISVSLNGNEIACNAVTFNVPAGGISPGDNITAGGNAGEYLIGFTVGTGPGTLRIKFDAQGVPDRIQALYSPNSNDIVLGQVVADSLYVGDSVGANNPQNGVYQNLDQFNYVGPGNGNTGNGNEWDLTGNGTVTIQIIDSIVCNNTTSKSIGNPNGQARGGANAFQTGGTGLCFGDQGPNNCLHADGHFEFSFTKGQSTSSIVWIRITSPGNTTNGGGAGTTSWTIDESEFI
jgi:hypothetical protein